MAICQTVGMQEVHAHDEPGDALPGLWSPKGCQLFTPGDGVLSLIPEGDRQRMKYQHWNGPKLPPRDPKRPMFVYAPSGDMVVGAWQGNQGPSVGDGQRGVPSRDPHQLWHVHTNPAADECSMTPVATSNSKWLIKTVAWQPGPRLRHFYAIASSCGSVHLVDARQHRFVLMELILLPLSGVNIRSEM